MDANYLHYDVDDVYILNANIHSFLLFPISFNLHNLDWTDSEVLTSKWQVEDSLLSMTILQGQRRVIVSMDQCAIP